MRRLVWWGSVAGFTACLNQPTLVSVTPDYGYVDGCIDVVVQGHHLGSEASAKVGDDAFLELAAAEEDPDRPEHAQDVGFLFTGRVPPSPSGEAGWFDVTVTVDGEDLVLRDGFYFRSCPGSFVVDVADVPDQAVPGDLLRFVGCELDEDVTVEFRDAYDVVVEVASVVSDCSTARVHAVVPTLLPGVYRVQLAHADGTVYLGPCSQGSGDTGLSCDEIFLEITSGSAR